MFFWNKANYETAVSPYFTDGSMSLVPCETEITLCNQNVDTFSFDM